MALSAYNQDPVKTSASTTAIAIMVPEHSFVYVWAFLVYGVSCSTNFVFGDISLQIVPFGDAVGSFLTALGTVSSDLNTSVNATWYVFSETQDIDLLMNESPSFFIVASTSQVMIAPPLLVPVPRSAQRLYNHGLEVSLLANGDVNNYVIGP
jgi:hypothetical protein